MRIRHASWFATPMMAVCAIVLLCIPIPAQAPPARAAMQSFVDRGEVAGVVSAIGRKDGVLSIEAVGQCDLESGAAMKPDALFRIASMTKPITAIGIMILVDEGKLAVDDPVEKHLPEFRGQMIVAERGTDSVTLKKPARLVTLRDLMTHTSGMPGQWPAGLSDLYAKRNRTLSDAILVQSQRPLEFEPGSKWSYCNPGIDTLGRVIEVLSGLSYEEFLRQRVFAPLGMNDTVFYPTPEQQQRVALTYNKKDGQLVAAPFPLFGPAAGAKYPIPAGGLYSTASDLAKLYRMMLHRGTLEGRRILSPEAVAAMTSPQTGELKTGFVDGMSFGFGWAVVKQPAGVTAMLSPGSYGHGGAFGTQGWIDPAKDLFVILLIQRTGMPNADASDLRRDLQNVAVGLIAK